MDHKEKTLIIGNKKITDDIFSDSYNIFIEFNEKFITIVFLSLSQQASALELVDHHIP